MTRVTTALPIDPLLPEIVRAVREAGALVLEAPPGAGKTTRVPAALLDAGIGGGKEIVVLQPRRLPTRLAAARVASERGERVGQSVGYQVRFEDVRSAATRLSFVTEGVLARRLLSEPTLPDIGAVVLDEFHERHLAGDLALAQLERLRRTRRPDLKLIVMSATLEAEPIAAYLGGVPRLRSEGRRFEVTIDHLPTADERHLDQLVLSGVKKLVSQGIQGDLLVFLPGAGEIRRSRETVADFAERHGFEVLPLHGDLSPAEQDRAVQPGRKPKIILSTNVAETSVTIEGVGAVLDTGLARIATHSPWSGLPTLKLSRVSKASAIQRAGRAGRVRAGHCLRLYTRHDFETRADHEAPEIRRLDLTEAILALRASGVTKLAAFPFFEAPPAAALEAAESLLNQLGAVTSSGEVSELGRRMLRFAVHPRQARLIVEAESRGVGELGALVAALLGERDIRREARASLGSPGAQRSARALSGPSDLLEVVERFEEARRAGFQHGRLGSLGLEAAAVTSVDKVSRQLARHVRSRGAPPRHDAEREQAIGLAVLAGYPDRVARRRRPKSQELVLCAGGTATLAETSVVHEPEFVVAIDAEERAGGRGVVVRNASAVEPEWLLELFPDAVQTEDLHQWNAESQRVERVQRTTYGAIALEESRQPAPPSPAASRVLAQQAIAAGLSKFVEPEALEQWLMRLEVLASAFPEVGLPSVGDDFVRTQIERACEGLRSFAELKESNLLEMLKASLSQEQARLLSSQIPDRVTLPGGRGVAVHYERGKPPWIESRLQDFFGMAQTPKIAGGRIPLVIHLLAPNMRAVQVTTDLAGFWERHYATIKKELARKYPRHFWPDDPLHSAPPPPRAPRPPRR